MTTGPSQPGTPLNYEPAARSKAIGREIRYVILLSAAFLVMLALLGNPMVGQIDWLGWGLLGTPARTV
jgi:hypothetical protein